MLRVWLPPILTKLANLVERMGDVGGKRTIIDRCRHKGGEKLASGKHFCITPPYSVPILHFTLHYYRRGARRGYLPYSRGL
jgi:hypothetical protein